MNVLAGEATVDQFYGAGLVRTPADLYQLSKYQLLSLEGWQDRSAQRFLDSLAKTREVPFERVLFALGIRYVGETTARDVARRFGSVEAIASASEEELLETPDVGAVIARSIYDYMHNPAHLAEIERLRAAGLRFSTEDTVSAASDVLKGKTIVVSGTFSVSRDAMKELIAANGGKCTSSVSASTSFLLAGAKPGPEKLAKCAALGVKVISEDEFRAMLPAETLPASEETQLSLF